MPEALVSGLGVCSAIGHGQTAFSAALEAGQQAFGVLARPGRQRPGGQGRPFIGAEMASPPALPSISPGSLRTASLSARAALAVLHEAWQDAALDALDPLRVGLIVGGSNVQQRELVLQQAAYAGREDFLRPSYGLGFMDSDLCGLATEHFAIRAFAHTLGGASASGLLAVIEAAEAVRSGRVDACIAIGALMDLSYWECQAFSAMGAMGSARHGDRPSAASRPFDRERDGFVYGEACGAVVVESEASVRRRGHAPWARLAGWATQLDGNRQPNPALAGECAVVRRALQAAGLVARQVDYVNPHASGSQLGDSTELQALAECGLRGAPLNTSKSLLGHGLTAAGAVETVATLLQMRHGRLHPCRNLEAPEDPDFAYVPAGGLQHRVRHALKLGMGFGGINAALCLENLA